MCHTKIPYSRKILVVYITTAKLKSAKTSYSHIYVWQAHSYQTTKFKSANILTIAILRLTVPANISGYMAIW